jgi:outer membrane receptor protein involved in Fe transport
LYPNAITRDNSTQNPGPITSIAAISSNIGLQLYRGIDYGLQYRLPNTRLGSFAFTAAATEVIKAGRDPGTGTGFVNNTGLAFDIEWRYNYGLSWNYRNWGARVGADVIGKFFNDNWTAAGWGENVYTTINPSVTYRGFRKLTLTLGFNNVLDHRPPPNGFRPLGFDDRLYGAAAAGIVGSFRVRKEF